MQKHNADNERIKRRYVTYVMEALGLSDDAVDQILKALDLFETYTGHRRFKTFDFNQAIDFKRHLLTQKNQRTGAPLSKATLHATLTQLKRFFHWLAGQPGFKSHFTYSDAQYFSLSDKDARVATTRREQRAPTIEQIRHAIEGMPVETAIDRRDRAIIAFTLLTGARDSATASLALKHVDLTTGSVYQDARNVKTKFSKTFTTWFFPVGDDIRQILVAWVHELREQHLFGNDDPLFPATKIALGKDQRFEPIGITREYWSTAEPIRAAFRKAFARVSLPYFNPHSFRNTLVRLGEKLCKSPEEFKAWSQNLGHEGVLTTLVSYGAVGALRQGQIIQEMTKTSQISPANAADTETIQKILRKLQNPAVLGALLSGCDT